VRGKRFVRERIELAGARVPFNGGVELRRIESLEPCTEPCQFARREPFDGSLDVFGSCHVANIALARDL